MVPSDLLDHCRLCLVKERVSVNIFENENEIRQLYYKILACLPVQISKEEVRLPHKICTNCNLKVDELYQFWCLTANSQKTLLQWLEEAEHATSTTKIKCEYDENLPTKVEPRDHSSGDENQHGEEVFEDEPYRDESDVPDDHEFEPSNMVNVSLQGGTDGEDIKPKKSSLSGTKKKTEKSSGLNIKIKFRAEFPSPASQDSEGHEENITQDLIECQDCEQRFVSMKLLTIHMKTHTNSKVFPCKVCMEEFSTVSEEREHFKKHITKKGKYKCDDDVCGYETKRITDLKEHNKEMHDQGFSTYCDTCGKGFFNVDLAMAHKVRTHGSTPYQCDICQAIFTSKSLLFCHKKLHKEDDKVPWQCELCSKVYTNKKSYTRHCRTHMGIKYECEICHKQISSKQHLKLHMRIHSKARPCVCVICGKGFKRQDYLREHFRTHTGERPFKCNFCGKGFTQKQAMITHSRSHTNDKPFGCEYCAERFVKATLLRYHLLSAHNINTLNSERSSSFVTPQFSFFAEAGLSLQETNSS